MLRWPLFLGLLPVLFLPSSCSPKKSKSPEGSAELSAAIPEPLFPAFASPRPPAPPVLIEGATLMTAAGPAIEKGYILLREGKIAAIASGDAPAELREGAEIISAQGKVVTPGLIDTHSHMGVYPHPQVAAHEDGNEMSHPMTPEVWAEHSFWPQDPSLWRALAAGVTSAQILPGSGNLIGGRSVTIHLRPGRDVASLRFPGAPQGMKMACGENPKRSYGSKSGPMTRMGNIARFRKTFQEAVEYRKEWDSYNKRREKDEDAKAPKRDHGLDSLVQLMKGEILLHVHCYRADEMALMLDLAKAYGFKIRSFHHALEAYKLADRLAAEQVAVSTWTDWWGFKMEAFDGIPQNAPLIHAAKGIAILHSDSEEEIRHLSLEAVKARVAGQRIGIQISDEELLGWITKNAAWALGIDQWVGTLEVGKLADVVLWDRHPFSSYAKPEKVFIMGEQLFDRPSQKVRMSDLEVGVRDYGLGDRAAQEAALPGEGIPTLPPASKEWVAPPSGLDSFVIENAQIETGTGERLSQASVWVEGGLIKAVNPQALAADVSRFDAGGRILTPGLIEVQSPLGLVVVELEKQGHDTSGESSFSPAFRAIDGLDPYSLRIPIARGQGLSSVLARPQRGGFSGQGQLFDLGMQPGSIESSFPTVLFASVVGEKNRGEFWLKFREALAEAQLLRSKGGSRAALSEPLSLSPLHLEVLADLLQGKSTLVLEVHRLADVQAAIRLKKELESARQTLRLVLSGAGEAWMAAAELAAAGIPVILTPSQQMPSQLDQLRVRDDQAALLRAAGVKLIISTNDINAGRLRQEAGRAVAHALPYGEALAAITSVPAEVFGWKDRGSIAVGKRADLVLWSDDPFEARSRVEALWVKGRSMSLSDRQLELAKTYSGAVP